MTVEVADYDIKKSLTKDLLAKLIRNNPYGRYVEDYDIPRALAFQYTVDCAYQAINSSAVTVIAYFNSSNQVEAVLVVGISDWDTQHFGKKSATIEYVWVLNDSTDDKFVVINSLLKDFNKWCNDNRVEFVTAKISSQNLFVINALERFGFSFIESWIYNKYDLTKNEVNREPELKLRLSNSSDMDYMLKYSANAFSTHRFHADSNIPYEKAESLYHKWIETSFSDKNQRILVYDHDGVPTAFMIYFIRDLTDSLKLGFAMWKMALINPEHRGKGLGISFFKSLLSFHKNEGLDVVDSGLSLRNIPSLNTHIRLNFKVISTLANFHLWI